MLGFTLIYVSKLFMQQWTGSLLVQEMACYMFGSKPLSEPKQNGHHFADDIHLLVWKLLYFDQNFTEMCL